MMRRVASIALTQARGFSSAPLYNTIPEVFDRIKHVSDSKVVKEIGAVFHFKIKNDKSYVVDLKTGEGCVATGDPKVEADVTVETDSANLLKLFNREIEPMNALTTGAVTLKGDLTKALTLEKVLKAAREAGK